MSILTVREAQALDPSNEKTFPGSNSIRFALAQSSSGCECSLPNGAKGHAGAVCALAYLTCSEAATNCKCIADDPTELIDLNIALHANEDGYLPLYVTATIFAHLAQNAAAATVLVRDGENADSTGGELLESYSIPVKNDAFITAGIIQTLFAVHPKRIRAKLILQPFSVQTNGIDDTLELSKNGRSILVHGPLQCPAGDRIHRLWISITQPSSGAYTRSSLRGVCTGITQIWSRRVKVPSGETPFQEGPAQVCVAALYRGKHETKSAEQWCTDVNLFIHDES